MDNENIEKIKKEGITMTGVAPIKKNESDELYSYEPAICKIKFYTLIDNQLMPSVGTGFFCFIINDNIPFTKALFTNNHVLKEDKIKINEQILIEHCKKNYTLEITKDRKVFTDEELDYTCIQILDTDEINKKIEKYFQIEQSYCNNRKLIKDQEIYILQYPNGVLSHSIGKIVDIEDNKIKHSASTNDGSSGSPLIKRYNNNLILGIHFASQKNKKEEIIYNLATPFDVIIQNICSIVFFFGLKNY